MEINSVVYMRTTHEPVFVLGIQPDGMVLVRRCLAAKEKFPEYRLEFFRVEELMSEEDHKKYQAETRSELAREFARAGVNITGVDFLHNQKENYN